jgi:hypothetical protein
MWLPFFAWSLALGLPQVWWITSVSTTQGGAFFAWSPGWDHGTQNIAWFWLKNTGLFIPLLVAALLWPWRPSLVSQRLRLFYLPFTLCFIIPNVFRLAPWIWDNVKVLVYWFIASVPLVALVLGRLMQAGRWRRALATAFLVVLIPSGALDLWRAASGAVRYRVFTDSGTQFAALVTDRINPRALILHAPSTTIRLRCQAVARSWAIPGTSGRMVWPLAVVKPISSACMRAEQTRRRSWRDTGLITWSSGPTNALE